MTEGNKNGTDWVPTEIDVSIRPGWFYHAAEDDYVKSADHLELIYYQSVCRNGNLLLNIPVDRRGLVHTNDSLALMALKRRLDDTFLYNMASGQRVAASNVLNNSLAFDSSNVTDGNRYTYWATNPDVKSGSLEIRFDKPKKINVISVAEYIPLGQRTTAADAELNEPLGGRSLAATVIEAGHPVAVFTASTPDALLAGMHDLVGYGQWAQLRGGLALWRPGSTEVQAISAEDAPFTAYTLRGGLGLWVSRYPLWALLILLGIMAAMVMITRVVLAAYRRRNLPSQVGRRREDGSAQ